MAAPHWGLAALLLGGCASVPLPHHSTDHPANAAAPEAPRTGAVDALDGFTLPPATPQAADAARSPAPSTEMEDPHAGHR